MEIIIQCECGNRIEMQAPKKKYLQLKDRLEKQAFHYVGAELNGDKIIEFKISCGKCHNWIDLGVD